MQSPGRSTATSTDQVIDAIETVARNHDLPMAQIALAWLLSKPVVACPIVGATKPRHLDDAVAALDVELTAQEIATLEAPHVTQDNYWW